MLPDILISGATADLTDVWKWGLGTLAVISEVYLLRYYYNTLELTNAFLRSGLNLLNIKHYGWT